MFFQQLYKKGLVYQAEIPVNWCPALKTVLANEEIVDGKSELGGHPIIRMPMRQWILKITAYADKLLKDLDLIDFPENIKEMQRNWIGRSEGANVIFSIKDSHETIKVFTTRPDTLFGATYMVIAPEHPLLEKLVPTPFKKVVEDYKEQAMKKSDLARTELSKVKTGVFTGIYAINPVNDKKIQVWTSDYVLITYGTGAIMAVPGHDQRDWEFANEFDLDIIEVISGGDISKESWTGDGTLINSNFLNSLNVSEAKNRITSWLYEKGVGESAIQYKLRDWVFSRQRYWGEPFPLILYEDGEVKLINEKELPLELPDIQRYEPSGKGESPLARIKEWADFIDPETGKRAHYETHTMPQWAGSCWYYLRYIDPKNNKQSWDKEKEKYWMPVDLYVGGAEHAVLHLLYARFWHKVLYDLDLVSTPEPFFKLINQGMILGEDGVKMSKSRGNVINPDEVINKYGADTFRMYEMFMGPLENRKPWSTSSIEGVYRFLNRIWNLFFDENGMLSTDIQEVKPDTLTLTLLNKTIYKVTKDIENLRFNTAISQLMIFINEISKLKIKSKYILETFLHLINPIVPHISEEIWSNLGHNENLSYLNWPTYDKKYIKESIVTIAVQVNGKVRGQFEIAIDSEEDEYINKALDIVNVKRFLKDKEIKKQIVIKNRIVSFVVK